MLDTKRTNCIMDGPFGKTITSRGEAEMQTSPKGMDQKRKPELQDITKLAKRPLEALVRDADALRRQIYGRSVFIRGLLEFTNRCICDCHYCGLRRSNAALSRYSLREEQIESAIRRGLEEGLSTFVLQGGEDPVWPTNRLCRLLELLRKKLGDSFALTLSCGIKSAEEYRSLVSAGADRYLLRFETSDPELHARLRGGIPLQRRLEAIRDLGDAGFEVGSGFMVGLPGETDEIRIENLRLCCELGLHMVGIGPFIANPETPLATFSNGSITETLRMTACLRLLLPLTNIPATTAAGSLVPDGRERMLHAGANVLMPNLTDLEHRRRYRLYPGKVALIHDGVEDLEKLRKHLEALGLHMSLSRGDSLALQTFPTQ